MMIFRTSTRMCRAATLVAAVIAFGSHLGCDKPDVVITLTAKDSTGRETQAGRMNAPRIEGVGVSSSRPCSLAKMADPNSTCSRPIRSACKPGVESLIIAAPEGSLEVGCNQMVIE